MKIPLLKYLERPLCQQQSYLACLIGVLLLWLTLGVSPLFAVDFSLSFSDKSFFYPDSKIELKAIIYNDGNEAFFFRTADNRAFNLKIKAYTLDNRVLSPSANYRSLLASNRPYFYRDMSLEPGEEYAFVFALNQFVTVIEPGIFILEASYSTDLSEQNILTSNKLYLNIRPHVEDRPEYRERIDSQTQELLVRSDLRPDEVVSYTLTALIRQYWNRFFLYLDLESLLERSSYYHRRYIASSEEMRHELLSDYRRGIIEGVIPEVSAITDVPLRFKIIRTSYSDTQAQVIVSQTFQREGYQELIRYNYGLHRVDNSWLIYRISTQLTRNIP